MLSVIPSCTYFHSRLASFLVSFISWKWRRTGPIARNGISSVLRRKLPLPANVLSLGPLFLCFHLQCQLPSLGHCSSHTRRTALSSPSSEVQIPLQNSWGKFSFWRIFMYVNQVSGSICCKGEQYRPSCIAIQYWRAGIVLELLLFQKVAILNTEQY